MRWLIRLIVGLNQTQLLLFLGLIALALYLLAFKLIGPLFGRTLDRIWAKKDLVEIVILGDNYNYHHPLKVDSLNFDYPLGGIDYRVNERALYKKDKSIKEQILDNFTRIRDRYLIIFRGDDPNAVEWEAGNIHPTTMAKVRTSQALKKALREMFRADLLQGRGIVVLIVVLTLLAVIIAKRMGVM